MSSPTRSNAAHKTAGLVYCLWLLGILFGITAIIGIVINHTKLSDVRGTHAYSHFIWQMISFWIVLAGVLASYFLWATPAGSIIAIISFFVWFFSGLIGSWYLSKSRRLRFLDRDHQREKHPHHFYQEN